MRAVAGIISIALVAGCFPHNPKARTISKLTEGGLIVGGIGLEFLANSRTGADCDMSGSLGMSTSSCKNTGSVLGGIGLGMILAGLTGFIATVSTASDEEAKPTPAPVEVKAAPEKPDVKLPPGVQPTPAPAPEAAPAPTGSAAPAGTASP